MAGGLRNPRKGGVRWAGVVSAAVALALALLLVAPYGPAVVRVPSPSVRRLAGLRLGVDASLFPVSHVVVVMMENHAYDSLFGAYCNENNGSQVAPGACPNLANGTPPSACNPVQIAGSCSAAPFFWSGAQLANLVDCHHWWNSSHLAYDGGAMDGFLQNCNGNVAPMGEYNGTTIPTYWDLAQEFGSADDSFSSVLSGSLGNHWYLLAGNAPSAGFVNNLPSQTVRVHHTYLNESNATKTIEQLIAQNDSSLTWRYYDWPLRNYTWAISNGLTSSFQSGSAYNIWNPLAAKAQSYPSFPANPNGTRLQGHFANRYSFFTDLAQGRLPALSWVIPAKNQSDHPPANITQGERLVQQVVDAVEGSPYWSSTAVFVTWDDFGGFYDSVAPPLTLSGSEVTDVSTVGLSFRTPLVVVSPFTPAGLVVHSPLSFEDILAFVEWRFGLGCLTALDCADEQAIAAGGGPMEFFPLVGGVARQPVYIDPPSNATYPAPAVAPAAAPFAATGGPAGAEAD